MTVLDAAQRVKLRRLCGGSTLSSEAEVGELNVVPFLDIIVNVLIFVLATLSVTFTASFDVKAPSLPGFSTTGQGLDLTVLVVNEGFAVKTAGGNVAPGCEAPGLGIAIPKRGGDYDLPALGACIRKLKQSSAEAQQERQIFLSANPGVEYHVIIAVIDAVRVTPEGDPLFPDVSFRVPR